MRTAQLIFILLIIMLPTASGMKQPNEYSSTECELIAKDYQREHGGSLVWIQPLKPNGAYDMGEYSSHILNKVGNEYIDYGWEYRTTDINSVREVYKMATGKDSQVWDLSQSRPRFRLIWHY